MEKESDSRVDGRPWVEGLTIGGMLQAQSERQPKREALVMPQFDVRWSYGELNERSKGVAKGLIASGVKRGDHVAIWATNWPEWVLLQFGTARIGAVLVTINPAYRASELAYVLKQSDTRTLFLIDRFRTSDYFQILRDALPGLEEQAGEDLQLADVPHLKQIVALKGNIGGMSVNWNEWLARGEKISDEELAAAESSCSPGDPINIQYTSGTTGFPKGATLTHRNLLLNAWYVGECQAFSSEDRVCFPVPFYHCFGCVLGVLGSTTHGATMIVPHEYFVPEETLKAIKQERATAIYGVPTMFMGLLDSPEFQPQGVETLRTGVMAGSPCPIELMNRVVDQLHAREVTIAYGLTEASPVITQTRTSDPLDLRVHTVGRELPGVAVRIVDPATGETLGVDQPGELCTKGHGVMVGYYNMPEATASTIDAEGWLHSGDLAVRLPNGYFHITGRLKEMICRGGENIYPREIEEFLHTHPAIQNIAVVGVPDPKFVEETAAWIKLRPGKSLTEEELRQFCKGKLAHYKVPRYIQFVEEFPMTVTGKIQKFKIREALIEQLGLQKAAEEKMA